MNAGECRALSSAKFRFPMLEKNFAVPRIGRKI
jgi:hypothetical protein